MRCVFGASQKGRKTKSLSCSLLLSKRLSLLCAESTIETLRTKRNRPEVPWKFRETGLVSPPPIGNVLHCILFIAPTLPFSSDVHYTCAAAPSQSGTQIIPLAVLNSLISHRLRKMIAFFRSPVSPPRSLPAGYQQRASCEHKVNTRSHEARTLPRAPKFSPCQQGPLTALKGVSLYPLEAKFRSVLAGKKKLKRKAWCEGPTPGAVAVFISAAAETL